MFKKLNLAENYVSITLGFLVVVIGGILLFNYYTGKGGKTGQKEEKTGEIQSTEVETLPAKHKVQKGENLWTISEKYYGSGYNWVTLAKENKLSNPNGINEGQEISIPKAETIRPEVDKISADATVKETRHTVVKGDNLWKIALNKYGSGYEWVKIAKANNLKNPGLIHAGNVLILP